MNDVFLKIVTQDKFVREIWLREFDKNDIPSDSNVIEIVNEIISYYKNIYPELENVSLDWIVENKIFIHYSIYYSYMEEEAIFEKERGILKKN